MNYENVSCLVKLCTILLPVPSLALTEAIDLCIKAFQNPVWAEQARNRLAQIKLLTKASTV